MNFSCIESSPWYMLCAYQKNFFRFYICVRIRMPHSVYCTPLLDLISIAQYNQEMWFSYTARLEVTIFCSFNPLSACKVGYSMQVIYM